QRPNRGGRYETRKKPVGIGDAEYPPRGAAPDGSDRKRRGASNSRDAGQPGGERGRPAGRRDLASQSSSGELGRGRKGGGRKSKGRQAAAAFAPARDRR